MRRVLRRMLRPGLDPGLEAGLTHQLGRLAERAGTSPDALERILEGTGNEARVVISESADRHAQDRRAWALAVPVAALVVAAALLAAGGGHLLDGHRASAGRVVVAGSAFPGERTPPHQARPAPPERPGTTAAAWVSAGELSISTADGGPAVTVPIPAGQQALNPEWSADGRWLAYLVTSDPAAGSRPAAVGGSGPMAPGPSQLRVVGANGSGDHQLLVGSGFAAFSWSPAADLIAAVPTAPSGRSEGLVVVPPLGGSARRLLGPTTLVNSFVWSPDGRSLAYASRSPADPAGLPGYLYTVAAAGGRPARVPWTPPPGAAAILADWWPSGQGLLVWSDPQGSAALADDGLPLIAVPLGQAKAHVLATTVVYLPWVDWSPDGRRLVVVEGSGRSPATGKALALCQPDRGTCHRLAQPAGVASVDPAWSPGGRRLAFVRTESGLSAEGSFDSRQLWVAAADGSGAHAVAGQAQGQSPAASTAARPAGSTAASTAASTAGPGVVLPAWISDSRSIGYSTADAVVLADSRTGQLRLLGSGLTGGGDGKIGPDISGKVPWQGAATWDTGPGTAAAAAR